MCYQRPKCAVPPGSIFFYSPGREKIPLFHFFRHTQVSVLILRLIRFCSSYRSIFPHLLPSSELFDPDGRGGRLEKMIHQTENRQGCLGTLFNVYCISCPYKKKRKKAIPAARVRFILAPQYYQKHFGCMLFSHMYQYWYLAKMCKNEVKWVKLKNG